MAGPKPADTRDVLAMTDIYFHKNTRYPPTGAPSWNPVGFFLVLWDDGEVTRVPYDKVLRSNLPGGAQMYAFPGQAGVPSTAVKFSERFKRLRRRGPGER